MTSEQYCRFYNLPDPLKNLLDCLPKSCWYLFQSNKVIDTGERNIILTTGFYTGIGHNCKRMSLTPLITKACVNARLRFSAYNDAPKGGVKGDKVKIYY